MVETDAVLDGNPRWHLKLQRAEDRVSHKVLEVVAFDVCHQCCRSTVRLLCADAGGVNIQQALAEHARDVQACTTETTGTQRA
jgi:hypothetical protein